MEENPYQSPTHQNCIDDRKAPTELSIRIRQIGVALSLLSWLWLVLLIASLDSMRPPATAVLFLLAFFTPIAAFAVNLVALFVGDRRGLSLLGILTNFVGWYFTCLIPWLG
jgi:hypothetical protein